MKYDNSSFIDKAFTKFGSLPNSIYLFATYSIDMKLIVLQFATIADLLDFEMNIDSSGHIIDHAELNITGLFTENEVRIATQRYNVNVSETVI